MCTATLPSEPRVYYRFEARDGDEDELLAVDVPQTLEAYVEPPYKETRFWKRQFGSEVTPKQKRADWIFGVMLPLVCFYFDPFVFRSWTGRDGMLGRYQITVYVGAYLSIMLLMAWLLWGDKLGRLRIPVALGLSVGAVAAGLIGVILFPFSLFGMFLIVGFLGYTPIFTAIVFWRNAIRALAPSNVIPNS